MTGCPDTVAAYRALCVAEEPTPFALTRRRFLQAAGAVGGGAMLAAGLPAWAHDAFAGAPLGADEGILVLILMSGGNDALNMVVPYAEGRYYDRRPTVAVRPERVLPLDGRFGLHPNLSFVKSRYEAGQVAVVNGVGYNGGDLSHFSSMARWMQGWSGPGHASTGWLGRWLDELAADRGRDPLHAVHLGSAVPLHVVGATTKAAAVGNDAPFGTNPKAAFQRIYAGIRSYAAGPSGLGPWGDALAATQRDQLDVAVAVGPLYAQALPEGELTTELALAARLINADLGTRVLTLSWGDFDGHNGHPDMHDARMAELDTALRTFFATLSPALASRVTVMTFSEFGRRLKENGSAGTDHGTTGTSLLIGAQVRGGMHGEFPSLTALGPGDLLVSPVHVGSVYAAVLERWLGADPDAVLGARHAPLDLFAAGPGAVIAAPPPGRSVPGNLVAVAPRRRLDTRLGMGVDAPGPLGPGQQVELLVAGTGDIPPSGVVAAVLNVTAVAPTEAGYLTVWPSGEPRPTASNLNFGPGQVVPNLVMAKIGGRGRISLVNATGYTDVVADVVGYVRAANDSATVPVTPVRLLDTRDGHGPIGPGGEIELRVLGGPVPEAGTTSVVLNVTVTAPTEPGFLTVYPAGDVRPWSSNLNFLAGQTVPNLVVAKVGPNGAVRFFNPSGSAHVIVDLAGYVTTATPGRGQLVALTPARVLDTRTDGGPLGPGEARVLGLAGRADIPASGVTGVVANVTVTEPTDGGYLTVWPADRPRPHASNLNFLPGQTVPNLVMCAVSGVISVALFNAAGHAHVIVDVVGYIAA